jgi:hypothetical protein
LLRLENVEAKRWVPVLEPSKYKTDSYYMGWAVYFRWAFFFSYKRCSPTVAYDGPRPPPRACRRCSVATLGVYPPASSLHRRFTAAPSPTSLIAGPRRTWSSIDRRGWHREIKRFCCCVWEIEWRDWIREIGAALCALLLLLIASSLDDECRCCWLLRCRRKFFSNLFNC